MIRVHKAEDAPRILRDRGVALTAELCRQAEAGQPLRFDRDVYGAPEVKHALRSAQHDKCCFCESKLGHAQFGDVEHYRPKAGAHQNTADPPARGYYWLAYAWDNLYLSCEVCNRRHKRGLFPLLNPDRRVASHHRSDDLHMEQPLFIDPGREDPIEFIEFRRELAVPTRGNPRGAATIAALQLNRDALWERRRDRRELLRACVIVLAKAIRVELSDEARDDVIRLLEVVLGAAADRGEYSSMTRSLLRQVAPWRRSWALPATTLLDALRADATAGRALQVTDV
jgi:uncharacterized protein (TIGR02646 family)